ncbi:MAG: DUF2958 domain-containing protein [Flavobacteriales bacterium]|nr:DUF2958 domain-containing protein [Flavobacteriales bacterium]
MDKLIGKDVNVEEDDPPVVKLEIPSIGLTYLINYLDPCRLRICHGISNRRRKPHNFDVQRLLDKAEENGHEVTNDYHFYALQPLSVYSLVAKEIGMSRPGSTDEDSDEFVNALEALDNRGELPAEIKNERARSWVRSRLPPRSNRG